jgi:hypothetical protein
MYFDGSLNLEGAGAGVLLISPTSKQLKYVLQIFWKVSNNEAEYEALLHGLRLTASLGIKRLLVYGDSALVINQVNKSWDRNKENMDAYCLEVCSRTRCPHHLLQSPLRVPEIPRILQLTPQKRICLDSSLNHAFGCIPKFSSRRPNVNHDSRI